MPKKRKSRGRSKGSKGRSEVVQCTACGALVPKDKAKKVTTTVSFIDPALAKELRAKGAYIAVGKTLKYLCISCAIFQGVVKIRARDQRKSPR